MKPKLRDALSGTQTHQILGNPEASERLCTSTAKRRLWPKLLLLKSAPIALLRSPAMAPKGVWAPQRIPVSSPWCSINSPPNLPTDQSTSAICFSNVWCSPLPISILHWQYFFTVKGDVRATRGMQACVHGGVQGMENEPKSSFNNPFIQKMNKMGLQYC